MSYKIKQTRKSLTIQTTILLFIISFSIYLFLHSDFFLLRRIEIRGNETVSRNDILNLADLPLNSDMFYLDLQSVAANLKTHPVIKNARVYRKLPNSVLIEIEEREPLALLPFSKGFLLIGKEFTVLKKVTEISSYKLPLITGLSLPDNIQNGQEIKDDNLKFAKEVIDYTWSMVQEVFCEINVTQKENIKMYTYEGIEVHFGNLENFAEKYDLFKRLYEEKSISNLSEIDYIDVSFKGFPVVKYNQNN